MRRARRARAVVALYFFVNGAVVGSWVPHIPDRARALGLNAASLGTLLLAGGLGAVLAMPLAGWLTARWGSRVVSTTAGALFPLWLSAAVLAQTVPLAALSLLLFGTCGATMDVAMNSQGVLVEEQMRSRSMSVFHGVYSLGGVAGSAITSAALAHAVPSRWLTLSMTAVLSSAVLAAAPALLPRVDEPASNGTRRVRPHGRLLLLGVLAFASMVSEGAVADWSGLFLRVVHRLGPGVVGYGFTAFSAAMVAGRLSGDWSIAHLGEERALRLGGLLGVAGLTIVLLSPAGGAGFGPGDLVAMGGFALLGIGLANSSPVLYRAAGRMPGVPSGVGIATAVGIGYSGLLAGPPALGFLGHSAGIRSIFIAMAVLCALLALAAPLVYPPPGALAASR